MAASSHNAILWDNGIHGERKRCAKKAHRRVISFRNCFRHFFFEDCAASLFVLIFHKNVNTTWFLELERSDCISIYFNAKDKWRRDQRDWICGLTFPFLAAMTQYGNNNIRLDIYEAKYTKRRGEWTHLKLRQQLISGTLALVTFSGFGQPEDLLNVHFLHEKQTRPRHFRNVETCAFGLLGVTLTTWGSDSSPSASLKSSSAPNLRIAVSSSLLNGLELRDPKRRPRVMTR